MSTEIPDSRQEAADGSFEIYLAWSDQVLKVGADQYARRGSAFLAFGGSYSAAVHV